MYNFTLKKENTGLLIIDVQERLFTQIDHPCEMMQTLQKAIRGFQILKLPIVVTEQYPQGLGSTIMPLKNTLGESQQYLTKTAFSCVGDPAIKQTLLGMPVKQWVLAGIEAHVCVLQTAKDLLKANCEVVVLNDAISSRSIFDFSTSIAEMRDCGVRISSMETVLFELLGDAKTTEFKAISALLK